MSLSGVGYVTIRGGVCHYQGWGMSLSGVGYVTIRVGSLKKFEAYICKICVMSIMCFSRLIVLCVAHCYV